ncbi:nucleolar and coiled-body phosphoprotein 1-like [Drosophila bipectinata]|uniref:nucleolar and coiled-body phosphoprotein 1-like n=1 Tax=Drosophila bipectinata TaxID=42026 RepID=UPI0038B4070E
MAGSVNSWKRKWPGSSAVMRVMMTTGDAMTASEVAQVVKFSLRCSRKPTKRYIESMLSDAVKLDFATKDDDNRFQFRDERRQDEAMETDDPQAATTADPQTQNASSDKPASGRKPRRAIASGRVCKPSKTKAKAKAAALKRKATKAMPSKAVGGTVAKIRTKSKPKKSVARKICKSPAKRRATYGRAKRSGITRPKKSKPQAKKCKSTDSAEKENNLPEQQTGEQAATKKSNPTSSGLTSMMEWFACLWKKAMGYPTQPKEQTAADQAEFTPEQQEELREICRGLKSLDHETYAQVRQCDFGFEWSSDEDTDMPSHSTVGTKRRRSSKDMNERPSKVQRTDKRKSPAGSGSVCKNEKKPDESSDMDVTPSTSTKRRKTSNEINKRASKVQPKRRTTPKKNNVPTLSLDTNDNDGDGDLEVLYSAFAPMDCSSSLDGTEEMKPKRRRTCREINKKPPMVAFKRRNAPKVVPQNLKVEDETNPSKTRQTFATRKVRKEVDNDDKSSEVLHLNTQKQIYLAYDEYIDYDSDSDL